MTTLPEFDKLQMYFGHPYIIETETQNIIIKQPTVGEIVNIGESLFYSTLFIFIGNPTSYRLKLWDMGIDWNKISDYDLFCKFVKEADPRVTSMLFDNLEFQSFEPHIKKLNEDTSITLYSESQQIELSEETYKCICEYLRMMFNIYPKVEKAKGKTTKELMIDEDRAKLSLENDKEKKSKSTLLSLISSCINHPGFKYKLEEINSMGIVQFMDSVQRLQIYESTIALTSGMYSGMCDMSKVDKKLFNFMRELDDN